MSKERDYPFEALAEVTSTDWNEGRGELNAALKSIREQSSIEDAYILADEIHTRAKFYREVFEGAALTPNALAKHWLRVFEEHEKRRVVRGTNQHVELECSTCGGDRFVLVGTRPAKPSSWMVERGIKVPTDVPGMEEYAACYSCNSAVDTSFWRADGSKSQSLDPARVQQMHQG